MLDWERRAYAVDSGRCSTYAGPQIDLDEEPGFAADARPYATVSVCRRLR